MGDDAGEVVIGTSYKDTNLAGKTFVRKLSARDNHLPGNEEYNKTIGEAQEKIEVLRQRLAKASTD